MRLTVESIADTVELLFGWLAGPDPKTMSDVTDDKGVPLHDEPGVLYREDIHDEKTVVDTSPPEGCIDTEGESVP